MHLLCPLLLMNNDARLIIEKVPCTESLRGAFFLPKLQTSFRQTLTVGCTSVFLSSPRGREKRSLDRCWILRCYNTTISVVVSTKKRFILATVPLLCQLYNIVALKHKYTIKCLPAIRRNSGLLSFCCFREPIHISNPLVTSSMFFYMKFLVTISIVCETHLLSQNATRSMWCDSVNDEKPRNRWVMKIQGWVVLYPLMCKFPWVLLVVGRNCSSRFVDTAVKYTDQTMTGSENGCFLARPLVLCKTWELGDDIRSHTTSRLTIRWYNRGLLLGHTVLFDSIGRCSSSYFRTTVHRRLSSSGFSFFTKLCCQKGGAGPDGDRKGVKVVEEELSQLATTLWF